MSMISKQVENLRCIAEFEDEDGSKVYAQIMREAANTIEELAAKIHAANMERSSAYYHNGWVPCEERLPESDGAYLVTITDIGRKKTVATDMFYGAGAWWIGDLYKNSKVTAWMPLPEPYRGDE